MFCDGDKYLSVSDDNLGLIAAVPLNTHYPATENAERIVSCVNACAGMKDPAAEIAAKDARIRVLEEALDAAVQVAFDGPRETKGTGHESINDWCRRVEIMVRAAIKSPS